MRFLSNLHQFAVPFEKTDFRRRLSGFGIGSCNRYLTGFISQLCSPDGQVGEQLIGGKNIPQWLDAVILQIPPRIPYKRSLYP